MCDSNYHITKQNLEHENKYMKTVQKVSCFYKYFDIYIALVKSIVNLRKKFEPTIINLFEERKPKNNFLCSASVSRRTYSYRYVRKGKLVQK